jgi:HK97 family phage major capsid protein
MTDVSTATVPSSTVDTGSFNRVVFPPDVLQQIWLTVLTGALFSEAIHPLPTDRGSVAFPKAAPTGAAWTKELDPLPQVALNDDADVIAACKLAGLIAISNESLADAAIPIGDLVGNAIRDSMGPTLDHGLLYGDGTPPNPNGIVAKATAAAAGVDFRAAVIAAYGELASAGAVVPSITAFAHPDAVAAEWSRVNTQGTPIHEDSPNGQLTLGPGIPVIGVPMLDADDILVADVSQTYLVQRDPFIVESDMGMGAGFTTDSQWLRVKARVNVNAPTPNKSLRLATISP